MILTGVGLYLNSFIHYEWILLIGILLWTVGEIFTIPFMSTHVSRQSTESNRGVYMGYFGATFAIAHILSPLMGTFILDHYGTTILWISCGVICFTGSIGMFLLKRNVERQSDIS